jgi:UDP-N-acetylglucosamine:LPS N-acetylglucosamine transferase
MSRVERCVVLAAGGTGGYVFPAQALVPFCL